jgi:hypothetical protein
LSFVNFQEKLTGTSFALCACEASFVRLAVCLALSALFASTLRSYDIYVIYFVDARAPDVGARRLSLRGSYIGGS